MGGWIKWNIKLHWVVLHLHWIWHLAWARTWTVIRQQHKFSRCWFQYIERNYKADQCWIGPAHIYHYDVTKALYPVTWSTHARPSVQLARRGGVQVTTNLRLETNRWTPPGLLWWRETVFEGILEVCRWEGGAFEIITRKPQYNLFWIEFYYDVAPCDKCLGCQKLAGLLKGAPK